MYGTVVAAGLPDVVLGARPVELVTARPKALENTEAKERARKAFVVHMLGKRVREEATASALAES